MHHFFTKMKGLSLLILVLFIASCGNDNIEPTDPIADLASDKSYLIVEMDGKDYNFIEGKAGIEINGRFSTSTQHPNAGHGGGFSMKDSTDWYIIFFFNREDLKANTANAKKLFDVKKYDYLRLDRNYEFVNILGVEVGTTKDMGNGTALLKNTLYQENQNPQSFEVTKVFLSPTSDKFVFVEGNFECWLGDFQVRKKVKGKFRIQVQVSE
ncbi:MAG: hypothetical protein ABIN80_01115 [Dyadobacter sp.]|uniref:hypothetical protein n=1 Tax=Dyadobacter sp. TaxID=1914288 RepID=UPI003267C256